MSDFDLVGSKLTNNTRHLFGVRGKPRIDVSSGEEGFVEMDVGVYIGRVAQNRMQIRKLSATRHGTVPHDLAWSAAVHSHTSATQTTWPPKICGKEAHPVRLSVKRQKRDRYYVGGCIQFRGFEVLVKLYKFYKQRRILHHSPQLCHLFSRGTQIEYSSHPRH